MRYIKKKFYIHYVYLVFISIIFLSCALEKRSINPQQLKTQYTEEEISLFTDIAFTNGYIRKWTKDIRVEVKGQAGVNCADIDSVINILAPLIKPLQIKRVNNNGNLIVHRGVSSQKLGANLGYASFKSSGSKSIISGTIYESEKADYLTLMHEFEHILGLDHPRKLYPFELLIWGTGSPDNAVVNYHIGEQTPQQIETGHMYFETWEEFNNFQQEQKISKEKLRKDMLTGQEKTVIRMLYSKDIKPGLSRKDFIELMGINENLDIWDN